MSDILTPTEIKDDIVDNETPDSPSIMCLV